MDPAATINLISGTHREEAWASTTTFPFKFSTSVNVLIVTTGNKTHIQFFLFLVGSSTQRKQRDVAEFIPIQQEYRLDSPASIF